MDKAIRLPGMKGLAWLAFALMAMVLLSELSSKKASKPALLEQVQAKLEPAKIGAALDASVSAAVGSSMQGMISGGMSGRGLRRNGLMSVRGFHGGAMSAPEFNTESYSHIVENSFKRALEHPLSTFSIDVDVASYANVRRYLTQGAMPPKDAVRIEELLNYFKYDYPEPEAGKPFSITAEAVQCPWKTEHTLVRIGLKGRTIPLADLPPSSLTFLVDTSGSMSGPRIELVKKSLRLLTEQLRPQDSVAIVAYAGSAGLVLPSTPGSRKAEILAALDNLHAGGSTAGGAGIQLAYKIAQESFRKKGNNRVILATDGDFNVGVSDEGSLVRLIEEKRESGVFLTVLGFGMGNYKDSTMEKLADKGNGNYAYIDDVMEARKVLVEELGGTLHTIAKDVKLQVEFNPARVQAYRLVGYENRLLNAEDFNDDKKDAGELGSGHTVTALYEVIPPGVKADLPKIDELKYRKPAEAAAGGDELLTVKFRYKEPAGGPSTLLSRTLEDKPKAWAEAHEDMKFAASVAAFGMLLRGSERAGGMTYAKIGAMAREGLGKDEGAYRAELLRLIEKARALDSSQR